MRARRLAGTDWRDGETTGARDGGWRLPLLLMLVATAAVAVPASASAQGYAGNRVGISTQNLPGTAAAVYERGASKTLLGDPTACTPQCQRLVQALEDEPGDPALVVGLIREANGLASRTGTLPPWSRLPAFTPAAAALTFGVGWGIGTGIRKKWIEDEVPPTTNQSPRFYPVDKGQALFGGAEGKISAPADGYHVWQSTPFQRLRLSGEYCNGMQYQPAGTQRLSSAGSASTWCPAYVANFATAHIFFRAAPTYKPTKTPTRPNVGDVPGWDNEPRYKSEVETRTREQLLGDDFPLFNMLADWATEPELRHDPRITEDREDHRCDRGVPLYENANGNDGPFALTSMAPFDVGVAPPSQPSTTQVSMKRGEAFWLPGRDYDDYDWGAGTSASKPEPMRDNWGGWGFRHIVTKQGWSSKDEAETRLALSTATPIASTIPTPELGKGGVPCRRTVVIDPSGAPSRDIVTSYSWPR